MVDDSICTNQALLRSRSLGCHIHPRIYRPENNAPIASRLRRRESNKVQQGSNEDKRYAIYSFVIVSLSTNVPMTTCFMINSVANMLALLRTDGNWRNFDLKNPA